MKLFPTTRIVLSLWTRNKIKHKLGSESLIEEMSEIIKCPVWVCNYQVTEKPIQGSAAFHATTQQSNLAKSDFWDKESLDIVGIKEAVSKGFTVVPSDFPGYRKKQNFKSTCFIFLDQDYGNPEETMARLSELDLNPALIYETLTSSDAQRKHRLVLQLDQPITNLSEFDKIIRYLLDVVPNLDRACKDPCRLYYPAKLDGKVQVRPSYIVGKERLLRLSEPNCQKSPKSGNSSINNRDRTKIDSKLTDELSVFKSLTHKKYLENIFQHKSATTTDNLWGRFLAYKDNPIDTNWLGYEDLRTIWCNLRFFKGGYKLFRERVKLYPYPRRQHLTNALALTRGKFDQAPPKIPGLGYSLYRLARGQLITLHPESKAKRVSLEEATKFFQDCLNSSLRTLNRTVNIINSYTGIGKSKAITKASESQSIIIAVRTHKHIADIAKYLSSNSKVLLQYSYNIQDIPEDIKIAWACHRYDIATTLMREHADQGNEVCQEIIKNKKALWGHDGSIIVTHEFVKHHFSRLGTERHIVFDENPFGTLAKHEFIPLASVKQMETYDPNWSALVKDWEQTQHGKFFSLEIKTDLTDELLDKMKADSFEFPVGLFDPGNGSITIQKLDNRTQGFNVFTERCTLPEATVLILDATPPKTLLKRLFSSTRVAFHDNPVPELTGTIKQHDSHSFSRTKMKDEEDFETLLEILEDANIKDTHTIVTFKPQIKRLRDAGFTVDDDCYFGNEFGFNHLSGKHLAIVGTPNLSPETYLAQACASGLDVESITETNMTFTSISYNGFTYRFYTFQHPELQKVHLEFVNGSLMQAVGRARALREDVEVLVFSNFLLDI